MRSLKLLVFGMLVVVLGFSTSAVAKIDPPTCTGCGIQLVLLRSPATAHIGETITYWISAEVGNFPPCCAISDVQLSWVAPDGAPETLIGPPGVHLNPSESTAVFTRNYVVAEGDIDPSGHIIASGQASGMVNDSPDANTPSTDTDEILVTILQPCIEVSKEVDCDVSKEGDEVSYHICIRNCSDPFTTLYNVTVVDDELGDLSGLFPDELTDDVEVCIDYAYTIQGDDPDPLVNTVTASGEDVTGYTVTDTATDEVDLIHPSMTVTKECQTIPVAAGGDAEFLVTITNTGDADLEISTNDPDIPPFTLPTSDPVFTQTVTRTHTEGDEVCNEIEVTWTLDPEQYCNMDNTETLTSGDCCPVSAPCIEVTKEVDCDISKEGDEVSYHICIRNCSDPFTELYNVTVVDDELGDLSALFPDELTDDVEVCIDYPYTIQPDDPDPLVNTVTATGEDEFGTAVTDTATDEVDLIHPSMTVTKECQTIPVAPGGDGEFLVTITNTGDADLEISTNDPAIPPFTLPTTDPVFTQIVTETHTGGEEVCNGIEVTWTLDPDQYCGMDNTDTISDDDCCPVSQPCVEVSKEVDCDISKEGDEVIYHICIRNCSDPFTELYNVTVVDDELGDLSGLFPDELTDNVEVCIDYPYTIQPDDPDPLVNTVTVSAEDVTGYTVTDTATDEVDLIHPSMTVTKECQTPEIEQGGDAEFLITITNTGDADLEISTNDPDIPDFTLPTSDPVFTQTVTRTHTEGDEVCNEIEVTWTLDPEQYCEMDNTDTISDDDCCQVVGEGCRLTGGGVDEEYSDDGATAESTDSDRVQFGGQAGAHTALPPQPAGEWTHHQQRGPSGRFTFHAGTSSAPAGTEVIEIRCSDPGGCKPSGDPPSPAKQVDFDGIGTFKNFGKEGTDREPKWQRMDANAKCSSKGGKFRFDGTFHYFQVNADDCGEPGNKNLDAASDPETCPPDGFGEKGDLPDADCDCADFYRITIYNGVDAADVEWNGDDIDLSSLNTTDVIYEFHGYLDGGNLQVHYLTGFDMR